VTPELVWASAELVWASECLRSPHLRHCIRKGLQFCKANNHNRPHKLRTERRTHLEGYRVLQRMWHLRLMLELESLVESRQWELVSPQSELVSPQSELVSPQWELVSPQSELVSPQSELVSPQWELVSPQSELVSPQSELVSPQSELVSERESVMRRSFHHTRRGKHDYTATICARHLRTVHNRSQIVSTGSTLPRKCRNFGKGVLLKLLSSCLQGHSAESWKC